jgi:hypothetical protein
MANRENFTIIFEKLKPILQAYAPNLVVDADEPGNYSLNTPYSEKFRKEVFFGAVQIKKNYVSFHLMPVYMFPDLLDGISEPLRKRMQGKSCFNFTAVDEAIFDELARLAQESVERVRQAKVL